MKTIPLNEQDILDIMQGATMLASGGGGSFRDGVDLLNVYKRKYPDAEISVHLVSPNEIEETSNGAVVAVMGAPTGSLAQPDLSGCVTSAFDELCEIAKRDNRKIDYMFPIEMGGFNTFVPMLISLVTGRAILDADACGRAVPGLGTVLAAKNGCDTAPVAMADVNDNRVSLIPTDKKDVAIIEKMTLPVVQLFEQNAGIAGWILSRQEITDLIPNGTITKSLHIGRMISELKAQKGNRQYIGDVFENLNKIEKITAKALHHSPQKIENYFSRQIDGWDVGEFFIGGSKLNPRLHVMFTNESLLVKQQEADQSWKTIITAPDIISFYDARTGNPLTNVDLEIASINNMLDELEIVLGLIKVDDKWNINSDAVNSAWNPYFERLGYAGPCIPYQ